MIDSSNEFFNLKRKKTLSSPLSLGRVTCKLGGRGEKKSAELSKLTYRMKNAIA